MKLFLNYSIDCETPPNTKYTEWTERTEFLGGPVSWEFAEASTRGFVELMREIGMGDGTTLFVYPDVAQHQNHLYRELANKGVEIALHLNGMRYSKLKGKKAKWLGAMSNQEQKEAISMGKKDLEDVIGRPCLGYRACYGSANNDTFPICEELGFEWASNSSGRCRFETYANWSGSWAYPHYASRKSKLIPGDMDLFEIPITRGLHTFFEDDPHKPFDLRVETPPSVLGPNREILRKILEENIIEMYLREVPIRTIVGASHNTNPYGDRSSYQSCNLKYMLTHTRDLAKEHGLDFVPASFTQMKAEADRVDSY